MKHVPIIAIAAGLTLLTGASNRHTEDTRLAQKGGAIRPAAEAGRPQHLSSPDQVPQGLSGSDWASVRQQYEQHRHRAVPADCGYQVRNPGQQWQTRFDGRGFTTRPDGADW